MKSMLLMLLSLLVACTATDVKQQESNLGKPASLEELQSALTELGKIKLTKITSANWQVPLSGLVNLKHPKAVAAKLEDRKEAIQLYLYVLEHPDYGTFLIDSGISEKFRDGKNNPDISFLVKKVMDIQSLEVVKTTAEVIAPMAQIKGVFLTHIHLDHIMGLADLGGDVPVYAGPGEAQSKALTHLATRTSTNRLMANVKVLQAWRFNENGIVDVFGDGSLWALQVAGHTPGSTAYLVMTTTGAQLIVGDTSHTRWGWENQVEPGSYSENKEKNAQSLAFLIGLSNRFPAIKVHVGHQP